MGIECFGKLGCFESVNPPNPTPFPHRICWRWTSCPRVPSCMCYHLPLSFSHAFIPDSFSHSDHNICNLVCSDHN